jgi:dihydroorotase (multifunctional complex type)
MIVETVIKNCKLVRPEDITPEGIAVDAGKIVAIASDNNLPQAQRVIDAKGNYVIPGIIDNHTHLGGYYPLDQESKVDTAAGAYGGVTTVGNTIGIGWSAYKESYTKVLDNWKTMMEQNSYVDFTMEPILNSDIQVKEMPLYAEKYGIPIFKIVLAYKGWEAEQVGILGFDDGLLYLALKQVSAIGPPSRMMLHCENIDIIHKLVPRIRDEEKREDAAVWADTRPGWVEALDIERAVSIAKIAKAPLYIVHLSSAEGVDAVAKAKAEGVDIIAETTPAYLTLTKYSPIGLLGKVNPPLKDEASIERLWEALKLGIVECMGTDHCSPMRAQKMEGGIWKGAPGFPGIETYLPVLLSEGVNKGRITLQKLVEICCANNARAFGIYPKKGVIRIGSDADLVIVDLEKKVKISAQTLHQISDFTIFEGWEVKGYPVLTMLRGNVVVEDGNLVGKAGIGKYLPRFLCR